MSADSSSDEDAVVIIGGGICGLCTAFFLREHAPSAAITLVEAEHIASKASGNAAGFLARDWHASPTRALGRLSYALHAELAARFGGREAYGYRDGLVSLSLEVKAARKEEVGVSALLQDEQNKESSAHSDAHRIIFRAQPAGRAPAGPSAWLDARNVRRREVIGGGGGGGGGDEGAGEGDTGAAQVDPRRFCETLWRECEGRGVRLVRGTADGLAPAMSSGRRRLRVRKHSSDADAHEDVPFTKLVIAAGPWSGDVLARILGSPQHTALISHLPGHSVVIEPSHDVPAEALFADIHNAHAVDATAGPELFTRPADPTTDGRPTVYAAGENTGPAALPAAHRPGAAVVEEEAIARLLRACALISPALARGKVRTRALCFRPMTARGWPYLARVPTSTAREAGGEVFLLSGHGPWGISLGPGSGKVMAQLVLGLEPEVDISQLDL